MQIIKKKLTQYQKDKRNANRGTAECKQMLTQALTEVGAGRSVVVDTDDELIAGNQTIDAALAAGITEAWEVELPPNVLLVAKRTDLDLDSATDQRARRLAYYDNLSSDKSHDYDPAILLEDYNAGLLDELLRGDELEHLQAQAQAELAVNTALSSDGGGDAKPQLKTKMVKAVLFMEDILAFERALRLAASQLHTSNRALALVHICKTFLGETNGQDDETGQFDFD